MVRQSNVLGTMRSKHVQLLPAVFFAFHLEERWGMDVQIIGVISRERLKIDVQLLLSANRKNAASRGTTTDDLE